jgi:ATPase family associated with various cellular activities (AAA)
MPADVSRLRQLRSRAQELNERFVEDLKPFLKPDLTFFRLPDHDPTEISVTTTCTCLMAAVLTESLDKIYKEGGDQQANKALRAVAGAAWKSSGLPEDNNFTSVVVLRASGFLRAIGALGAGDIADVKHGPTSLSQISAKLVGGIPESFRVSGYPPTPTLAYWLLDSIENLEIEPSAIQWTAFADWAAREFNRQLSYVVARDHALLDPVAMTMAASLLKRLLVVRVRRGLLPKLSEALVPLVELRHGVSELFRFQTESGIWPKFFPLFHYQDAGSNYCFTFEFLEAILKEFGDRESQLCEIPSVLPGLELAVEWCDHNRMTYRMNGITYTGWNSGGEISTLSSGIPESWATATVHMFLARLTRVLSDTIDDVVASSYVIGRLRTPSWDQLIDVDITVDGTPTTFKEVIQAELIDTLEGKGRDPRSLRRIEIEDRSSVLLFGPPGTSKTTFVRALAQKLEWRYIEISPSVFLGQGLEHIYGRTAEIFADLMDLSQVVVLFDEMDALGQTREEKQNKERLDAVRQLLTTSMLPKLSALHDRKQVLFFMATNHREGLDPAIVRAGRFDILLCPFGKPA